ncbi:hypothetical protein QT231_01300 [Halomonas sp. SpR1]|uniref:hypothetical protein n=1 Tax=Halomonas sp. SpR1 TaxID=3050462 RepID=UPI0027E49DB9|nr:hypothetical protein [Halomonas sp. SpR1]MDQ7731314.1 hypothetical protein [Halomonas sp. SpR1]
MLVSLKAIFQADEWFKAMIIFSAITLLLSLTVDLQVDNICVMLTSLSVLFWNIGEMAYRPYREVLDVSPMGIPVAKLSGRPRVISASGIALQVMSVLWAFGVIARIIYLYRFT